MAIEVIREHRFGFPESIHVVYAGESRTIKKRKLFGSKTIEIDGDYHGGRVVILKWSRNIVKELTGVNIRHGECLTDGNLRFSGIGERAPLQIVDFNKNEQGE